VIEHMNRMAPDLAPEWATAPRDGTYRVIVEGSPELRCDLVIGTPETASEDGMIATTMRIVNAIPYVCDAPPGLVSSLDLPLTTPRHVFD
jgi:2,4-diaminopentanoate dehydrogenase